jgi:hypothetical protein
LRLLTAVAAHMSPKRRAHCYALGAAWYWWGGFGPAAGEWAASALDCDDPPHLAELIASLVAAGIFPASIDAQLRQERRDGR